jgi:hypothetical protein
MSSKKILILALCVITLLIADVISWAQQTNVPGNTAQASAKTAPASGLMNKRALDTLKLMSDTITQAKNVRFQVRSMVPIKTSGGMWINLYGTSRVVKQGTDKLFVSTGGDLVAHEFYFDGKTITKYSPEKNVYAVKEAPGTIEDLIEKAYSESCISFPYSDLLISDPYAAMTEGLTSALYVGQSIVKPLSGVQGSRTDHLAFSNKGVQWQIWIDAEDHLPRLVVATYLDDASEPSYTVEFGDWKLNEPVDSATFTFNNVSKASRVEYRNPAAKK